MTAAATEFVRPLMFEALTGRPVGTSLWEAGRALDHIRLGREPDLVVVAPATARLHRPGGAGHGRRPPHRAAAGAPRAAAAVSRDERPDVRPPRDAAEPRAAARARRARAGAGDAGRWRAAKARARAGWSSRRRSWPTRSGCCGRGAPFAGRRVLVTAGPTREALDPVRVHHQPLERPDGLRAGPGGVGARRGGDAGQRARPRSTAAHRRRRGARRDHGGAAGRGGARAAARPTCC